MINWKASEVERYGWTFWSFAYARSADKWLEFLKDQQQTIVVLCSYSPNAKDPFPCAAPPLATHYCFLGKQEWSSMPPCDVMNVTNPFKRKGLASAFKVKSVRAVDPLVPNISVEWFSRTRQQWKTSSIPTRGEYLVRPRVGGSSLRPIAAILELERSYLATLKNESL